MFANESPAVWLGHGYQQLVATANELLVGAAIGGSGDQSDLVAPALEPDETRQTITFLIVCLIGIATLLSVLTVWYWQFTSPRRRTKTLLSDLGHYEASADLGGEAEIPVRPPTAVQQPAAVDAAPVLPPPPVATPDAVCEAGVDVDVDVEPTVRPPATAEPAIEAPKPPKKRAAAVKAKPKVDPGQVTMVPPGEERTRVPSAGLRSNPGSRQEESPRRIEVAARQSSPSTPKSATTTQRSGPIGRPKAIPVARASADRSKLPSASQEQPETAQRPPAAPADGREGLSDDDWAAAMQSAFSKLKS